MEAKDVWPTENRGKEPLKMHGRGTIDRVLDSKEYLLQWIPLNRDRFLQPKSLD